MRISASTKWWSRLPLFAAAFAIAAAVTPVLADSVYPTRRANWQCSAWGPLTPPANAGISNYCMTDNVSLFWASDGSLSGSAVARINTVLEREFEPTDLNVNTEEPDYGGPGQTDIIYGIRSNVPAFAEAITWCDDTIDATHCDQHFVMFKNEQVVSEHNICHETGHAVGLLHGYEMSPQIDETSPRIGCMGISGNNLGSEMQAEINRIY